LENVLNNFWKFGIKFNRKICAENKKILNLEEWNLGNKKLSKTHLPSTNPSGGRIVV